MPSARSIPDAMKLAVAMCTTGVPSHFVTELICIRRRSYTESRSLFLFYDVTHVILGKIDEEYTQDPWTRPDLPRRTVSPAGRRFASSFWRLASSYSC